MSRELLRITLEDTFGVFNATPEAGERIILDIQQDNGYTVRPVNEYYEIRSAASANNVVLTGSDVTNLTGNLVTYMRASYAEFLINLAVDLTGSNCKDIKSFTVDYGTFTEDGTCTAAFVRHLGCKMSSMRLACDNTSQGQLLVGTFGIVAQKPVPITVSDFPIPAAADYDNDKPLTLRDSEGLVLLDGVARDPESLEISIENVIQPYRGNGRYISRSRVNGRTSMVTLRGLYLSNADRVDYEGVVAKSMSVGFDDGTNTLTFDFGDNNLIKTLADDFKMSDWNRQTVGIQNFLDGPGGVDFTVSVEANTP